MKHKKAKSLMKGPKALPNEVKLQPVVDFPKKKFVELPGGEIQKLVKKKKPKMK